MEKKRFGNFWMISTMLLLVVAFFLGNSLFLSSASEIPFDQPNEATPGYKQCKKFIDDNPSCASEGNGAQTCQLVDYKNTPQTNTDDAHCEFVCSCTHSDPDEPLCQWHFVKKCKTTRGEECGEKTCKFIDSIGGGNPDNEAF